MTFSEILKENSRLKKELGETNFKVTVLSNIIVTQSQNILEYFFRKASVNAEVAIGDYDNIVQDSIKFKNSNCVIIFWELSNIIDGLHYKIETFNDTEITQLIEKLKSDILFCVDSLKSTQMVVFNKFSTLIFNHSNIRENRFDFLCNELNRLLESINQKNLILIDINKVISKIGIDNSVDYRYFYSSKALYSIEFYKNYASFIAPVICSINGKAKKALIFDCDNTLWNGVVGEDGVDGIFMSSKHSKGIVFEEVQNIAVMLAKKGIIIGLCSKNNESDVEEILHSHSDMILLDKYIAIKKINWNDKANNIVQIAKELNVGLDSVVFVDDSDFEINLVREKIPEVTTILVPKNISVYPKILRENLGLFFRLQDTPEDFNRIADYKAQTQRDELKNSVSGITEYLASLEIRIVIYVNNKNHIARIAQLTQKTNQFNLTTKRYTESDISKFMESDKYEVYSFEVYDKFSDSGLTAICILEYNDTMVIVDSFMMSCRIIGRNIEFAIFDYILLKLSEKKIKSVESSYVKTVKNHQVSCFYNSIGFFELNKDENFKKYKFLIGSSKPNNIEYIKVEDGR